MKHERKIMLNVAILVIAFGMAGVACADDMGTSFTYQGRLMDANSPADDVYDFEFKLFDQQGGSNQFGNTVTKDDVDVIDGYFTVQLDFVNDANVFDGDARWLEIAVRPGELEDPCDFATLSPRQQVTPTPYALHTRWLFVDTSLSNVFLGQEAGTSITTGVANSAVGYKALFSDTTGNSNSAMGTYALYSNTEGYSNSAMGRDALYSNTTGYNNSAIGLFALYSNTTGTHNSAMGTNALYSNTTGYRNSAIGTNALSSNTTGTYNSAIGFYALSSNTTGYNNSSMGSYALHSNSTGYNNSAMGYYALRSNTEGPYNSAMGTNALYSNTTGYLNSAMGYDALRSNTTGYDNVGVGAQANYFNQEGSRNTIIGREAGRGTSAHNKSGNVFLGYKAGYNEIGDNKLYIANSDADPPLIYGDFSTGNLGIGTTTPATELDVVGTVNATAFVGDGSGLTGIATGDSDWTISGNDMYSIPSGNVGIGQTSPAEKLDVNGNININSVYKIGGETVLSVPDTQNTLVGVGAGENNTDGAFNTFIGYRAGYANTTSSSNTFLGPQAGYSNTTGYNSTFLGYLAGFNSTVDFNTFVGSSAGYSTSTGAANTFIGTGAGYLNTEGRWNTFLGYFAGYSNTTGNENTFLGRNAGFNTTGSGNVFIGYEAGYNETGSNNLYIANSQGLPPLIYGEFGYGNVGIGTISPKNKLHVEGAVAIGASYSGTVTAPTNGMIIEGNVGIGTTTPTEELEVAGNAKVTGDLIVDGSISGGIKQLVSDFVVAAGESVTAGDVVSFLDGYVQKGFIAGSPGSDSITYDSSEAAFKSDSTYSISAAALSDTKFVAAYGYEDEFFDYYGNAVIGQISGSAITYGTDYEFSSNLNFSSEISVAALSATKFVMAYTDVLYVGYAQIGEVSGDTISYGTANLFNSYSSDISVAALTDSKFVVAYRDRDNSSYGTARIGDVSGTTISYGLEYEFNSASTYSISVDALSETKFVVAYSDSGNSLYGTAIIGDVNITAITLGTEYVFNYASTNYISAAALSSTKFVVAYQDDGNSDYGTAVIGQISGSTITFGTEYVFNSQQTQYFSVACFSADRFVVAYDDYIIDSGIARIGQVSGDTITYGSVYQFNADNVRYISTAALSDSKFVVAYMDDGNSDYGTARIGNSPVDLGDAVVGIASDSKTAGQTVPVIIGGVSDVHSSLTAGTVYYAGQSGDLTTTANNYRVGVAVSDTQILLNSDRDNEDQFFGDMIFANNFRITEATSYEGLIFKNQLGSEILNITGQGNLNISSVMRLEPGSAPASPLAGDLYFDSSDNKLKCYDGTTWQACF